jgi:hypothetical protein
MSSYKISQNEFLDARDESCSSSDDEITVIPTQALTQMSSDEDQISREYINSGPNK